MGQPLPQETTISFAGTADDNEDGDLTASLSWNSDADGIIGTGGGSFSAVLSDGSHNITATVADSSEGGRKRFGGRHGYCSW